jgi:two-component system, chemotaxis family, response regulator PixG
MPSAMSSASDLINPPDRPSPASPPRHPHPELSFLLQPIRQAAQAQFDGNLCLRWGDAAPWGLTFRHGRLVWAWAGNHRRRRWRRLLAHGQLRPLGPAVVQSPELGFNTTEPVWEYETLKHWVNSGQINRETALAIARETLLEVVFDLVQMLYASGTAPQLESQAFKLEQPLKFFSPSEICMAVGQSWKTWCEAELQNHSPMLAPYIYQAERLKSLVSETSYRNLEQHLQGQLSLRELSTLMNQNLLSLSRTLVSYERRCLIKFTPIAQPLGGMSPARANNAAKTAPLILCIDDSESICQQLGKVVENAGYRYAAVQDSLTGLQRAIETQPSLIFLDLVMPIVSGYELCTQIRRVGSLREIPIIILTSNDSIVDRVRLKVAGSTIFLTKPINASAIEKVLDSYCKEAKAA